MPLLVFFINRLVIDLYYLRESLTFSNSKVNGN